MLLSILFSAVMNVMMHLFNNLENSSAPKRLGTKFSSFYLLVTLGEHKHHKLLKKEASAAKTFRLWSANERDFGIVK